MGYLWFLDRVSNLMGRMGIMGLMALANFCITL